MGTDRGLPVPWFVRVLRAIDKLKPEAESYATAYEVYGDGSKSSAYAPQLEDAFYRAVRLPNGTLKTTRAHRLNDLNRLVQQHLPERRPLRIKDVAVSSGVGTLEWARELRENGIEHNMTATDLTISALLVSFSDRLRVLFDSRGAVLQIDIAGYPAYPRLAGRVNRRLAGVPARVAGRFVAGELAKLISSPAAQGAGFVRQLELVTPGLREAGIELREEDLASPAKSEERWDVVRAANVLNRAYFGTDTLRAMLSSVTASVEVGGLLAVCRTELDGTNHGSVWRSRGDGTLELLGRVGRGSEIEDLVSERQSPTLGPRGQRGGRRLDGDRLPRVLFVIGSLEFGGSESQLVALLERIHGVRVDARLATVVPASDHRLAERVRAAGVPVVTLGGQRNRIVRLTVSAARFAALARSARPDLVYPWLEEATLLAAPLARLLRVPVLVARRNVSGQYAERARPIVSAIHAAERLAVLATANSSAVAAETTRRGIPSNRVRVIANGYDPGSSSSLPCNDVVVLGYVARMRPEKGHRRLLAALAGLDTATPWRVDLAGDGPLQGDIEAEARRAGLDGKLRFLGAVEDVPAFWSGCDAALLLSDHEGSPNALIEAAGMGRPVLATAVGGIPEFVDDEVGILVAPDDHAGLVAALRRLIEDPALRERLGAAARQRVTSRFSMERFVDGHCAAINEALELSRR